MLTLVFKTRIKLFYRPANLTGKPYDAYKSLQYKYSNNKLDIHNPSAYHVVFEGIALGKTDPPVKSTISLPASINRSEVPASAGKTVQWAAINDYGGATKTETRTLQ